MILSLTLTRAGEPSSSRELRTGTCRIGRAADNDWVLPDPDRLLSKRHCVVSFEAGEWCVADLSTNGTFLNREAEPIGAGGVRDLRDGDRLRLGSYEIEVRIAAAKVPAAIPAFTDADPFAIGKSAPPFAGPVQADHAPGIEDAFVPPRPAMLLGDDWDIEATDPPAPIAPLPIAPVPVPPPPAAPAPSGQADLLAAFLRGAGLSQVRPADPAAAMEALGAGFRALVAGLREALIARGAIKGEFRIAQTVLRPRGNNPLKFAAGDDDALAALLGVGQRSEMAPQEAITEALDDMRLHELATIAAMQTAVRALLAEFAPAKFSDGAAGVLPAQRKARAWDAFEAQHARISQALSDDFDSAFGRAFARAYERALAETRPAGMRAGGGRR